ncbi:Mfs1.1 [Daedaleopsis nitida]|nr:Mfs1.1 [Daedaleopsis nitida]
MSSDSTDGSPSVETSALPSVVSAGTASGPPLARRTSKGVRFWLILTGLVLSSFIAVLEGYAVSTALPTIVSDLQADSFIWVASAYAISSTVLLPLMGGLAEVFGRRPVMLGSLAMFALGAAICGAAQDISMLIAGRALHGVGSGGIFSSYQIILSDIVTLQERGTYNGIFGLVWAFGGGLGPLFGGALSRHTTWRWVFYINVPVAGVVFILLAVCLQQKRPHKDRTLRETLVHLDLGGNTVVIASSCSCALGLTWGGVQYPWASPQVLIPLCIGAIGVVAWVVYESRYCKHPSIPFHILSNRTSLSGYLQIAVTAFININLLCEYCRVTIRRDSPSLLDYLPVYYQACKDASPTSSGIDLLGLCFSTGTVSIVVGASIARTKRYRPQLWFAWCLTLVGVGLISTITEDTSKAASIGYQVLPGLGIGILYSGTYFPVLAPLSVTLNASALAFFVFVRLFAQIWGVTIGGALLQNELSHRLPSAVQESIEGLDNIAYAIIPLIPSMEQPLKDATRQAFAEALARVWRVVIAAAGIGFLASLPMKGVPLHTATDENWAIRADGQETLEKTDTHLEP